MAFLSKVGNILRQTANASKHINAESLAARPLIFQVIRSMSPSKVFVGDGLGSGEPEQENSGANSEGKRTSDRSGGSVKSDPDIADSDCEIPREDITLGSHGDLYRRDWRRTKLHDRPSNYGGLFGGGWFDGGGGDGDGSDDFTASNQSGGLDGGFDLGCGGGGGGGGGGDGGGGH